MIRCSYCKTENADSAKECKQCGKTISHSKVCDNEECRLDLSNGSESFRFCPFCGNELKQVVINKSVNEIKTITIIDYSLELVMVKAGTFLMGATKEQQQPEPNEFPVHRVTILDDYYITKYPITSRLWKLVMGSSYGNPISLEDNNPVRRVSYNECLAFCKKLSEITQKEFRLPTEAEWEFAARGGVYSKHTQYSGSNYLDEVGWYKDNCNKVQDVGLNQPNELGIYDMCGNVKEYCLDSYYDYIRDASYSPCYISNNFFSKHIARGGSISDTRKECRLSYRTIYEDPVSSSGKRDFSFRVVLPIPQTNIHEIAENINCPNKECKAELRNLPKDILSCPHCGSRIRNPRNVFIEKIEWSNFKKENNFKDYLKKYPDGIFKIEAEEQIREDDEFFLENCNNNDGLKYYMRKFPHGKHIGEAIVRLKSDVLYHMQTNFIDVRSFARKEFGFWFFMNQSDSNILKLATSIAPVDNNKENYILQNKDGKYGICEWNGDKRRILLPIEYDMILFSHKIWNFLAIIKKENKFGIFATSWNNGMFVLKCEYDFIFPWADINKCEVEKYFETIGGSFYVVKDGKHMCLSIKGQHPDFTFDIMDDIDCSWNFNLDGIK